ncbi:hypothetical protein KM043_006639 [Ampulex compressa]|nr:hypothetical protein KM043_006639 [Ampulex compressa]
MVAAIVKLTKSRLIEPYKKWILANPQLLSEIESTVQFLSYFTAGRFTHSSLAAEFIYSMPNLIILCNDLLIYSGKCVSLRLPQYESKIKIWLTVVEYVETLLEISAKRLWGQTGKWLIIAVVQILKTVLRLLLIYVYKERITKYPPVPSLDREKLKSVDQEKALKEGFHLKRSGTIVRSVRAAGPVEIRAWAPLSQNNDESTCENKKAASKKTLILAESLYILKPLLHLGCISITGETKWQPWMLSLVVDLISLRMFNNEAKEVLFTKEEQREFFRRRMSLLLYLIRSPFYDTYTRAKIYSFLSSFSKTVPFGKVIADPLKLCLPHWQSTYFYMWSS